MPTRFIDPGFLKRAFDALVPADAAPKEFLRWKELSRKVGLGEHWIRKRYHGIVQSELDVRSIALIRKALERQLRDTKEPALRSLIEQLSAADVRQIPKRISLARSPVSGDPLRMRVVNVGFIRGSSASYVMRLESGIRSGMVSSLHGTHLVDDESLELAQDATTAAQADAIRDLLERFNTNPIYVDRTYLVTLGTPATRAMVSLLERDARFRNRLGKDFRIIFAAVTNPEKTGILGFDRDYVAGMAYGDTAVERIRFVAEAFPGKPVAYLHDPDLLPDAYILEEILDHPELGVLPITPRRQNPTILPAQARGHLVMGWYFLNIHIHQLVRDNPDIPFVGINTTDLSRGAVLSTGNDDFQSGVECAQRLIVPDCCNEINLRDTEILKPQVIYGINQKACNAHGLVPRITARNKCRIVVD